MRVPGTRVAQHFALDTFEASLLASWQGIPGEGGHGDPLPRAGERWRRLDTRVATVATTPSATTS